MLVLASRLVGLRTCGVIESRVPKGYRFKKYIQRESTFARKGNLSEWLRSKSRIISIRLRIPACELIGSACTGSSPVVVVNSFFFFSLFFFSQRAFHFEIAPLAHKPVTCSCLKDSFVQECPVQHPTVSCQLPVRVTRQIPGGGWLATVWGRWRRVGSVSSAQLSPAQPSALSLPLGPPVRVGVCRRGDCNVAEHRSLLVR